jgi:transcriptional regulator of arginine metabolism
MRKIAGKKDRQAALIELVQTQSFANQDELRRELGRRGIDATQSSISRDLIELRITKSRGKYHPPAASPHEGRGATVLGIDSAGGHLVVIKTPPGEASMLALAVDREQIPGIVGTVAGDDTIFVALRSSADQKSAMEHIRALTDWAHRGESQ